MSTGARDDGETAASATARAKFRVLCLHGFAQDAATFRAKTGAVRKQLRGTCEFYFVDAPHDVSGAFERGVGASDASPRAWFTSAENARANANASTDEGWTRPAMSREYIGWDESLDVLRAFQASHGPFDGVLGFSQGSTAAAAALADDDELRASVKFVVLVAGFEPRDARMVANMNATSPFSMPSLHVHGDKDALITRERASELAARFDSTRREFFFHDGSHGVPTSLAKFIKGWLARGIERGL